MWRFSRSTSHPALFTVFDWLILYTVCRRSVGGVWFNLPGSVYLGGKISAATGALHDECCWPCTSIAVASFSVALRCNDIRDIAEEATLSGSTTVLSSSPILNPFGPYSDRPPSSARSPDLFEVQLIANAPCKCCFVAQALTWTSAFYEKDLKHICLS